MSKTRHAKMLLCDPSSWGAQPGGCVVYRSPSSTPTYPFVASTTSERAVRVSRCACLEKLEKPSSVRAQTQHRPRATGPMGPSGVRRRASGFGDTRGEKSCLHNCRLLARPHGPHNLRPHHMGRHRHRHRLIYLHWKPVQTKMGHESAPALISKSDLEGKSDEPVPSPAPPRQPHPLALPLFRAASSKHPVHPLARALASFFFCVVQ